MNEYDNVSDELEALISNGASAVSAEDDKEDTDPVEDEGTETETNDELDGEIQDTDEVLEDDEGVNTPADDDDLNDLEDEDELDDEDEDEGDEPADETDKDGEAETEGEEDSTDTEGETDVVEPETTDTVDYQKEYQELLEKSKEAIEFRDKIVGVKFKANGKEVEGFSDPEKLIQAQQLAYNYSAKMAGFKQYRPFMQPLKDRGLLDNPEKFDLAMSLVDGNTEALKQYIQDSGIDPLELDMEDIKYESAPSRTSADMIAIEDAMDAAKMQGVDQQVYKAVVQEWDTESFQEFVDKPEVQKDLIAHVADGSYDKIMQKVEQMSVLDAQYAGQKMTNKYRQAIAQLNAEGQAKAPVNVQEVPVEDPLAAERAAFAAEKAAFLEEAEQVKQERAIMASRKKNEAANNARRKGASVSKNKTRVSRSKKVIDPMSLDGAGVSSLLDSMIMGK